MSVMSGKEITQMILKKLTPEVTEVIRSNLQSGLMFPYMETVSGRAYILKRAVQLFKNSAKIYLPVHVLFLILRIVRSRKNRTPATFWRAFKAFVGSGLFATIFACSIPFCYCFLKAIAPNCKSTWLGMGVSFTFCWAIFFESSTRWGEMSMYVLAQWFEGFVYSLYKRQYLPVIPHWEKYLLMLAFGIISWGYYEESKPAPGAEDCGRKTKLEIAFNFIVGSSKFDSK